jgi:hypothetical protein
MKCPRCQIDFNAGHWGECPHCGEYQETGVEGVIKTSTILISSDEGGVFRSMEEVPEPLRQILASTTTSANSATIVIADQGGRERIAAALRNLPQESESRPEIAPSSPQRARMTVPALWWAGLLAAVCAAAVTWVLCSRVL